MNFREAPPLTVDQSVRLRQRVEEIKRDWARTRMPDTQAALSNEPGLQDDKSLLLNLAYEEYCIRQGGRRAT